MYYREVPEGEEPEILMAPHPTDIIVTVAEEG